MKSKSFPYLASALVLVSILAALVVLDRSEQDRHRRERRLDALHQLSAARSQLESALNSWVSVTRALAAYAARRPDITEEEFHALARSLMEAGVGDSTLALAMGWDILHAFPPGQSLGHPGRNPIQDDQRRRVMRNAAATGRFFLGGPFESPESVSALFGCEPVMIRNEDDGEERLWGFAILEMEIRPILQFAGLAEVGGDLVVSLRGRDGLGGLGDVFFGDQSVFLQSSDPVIVPVSFPNGSWQLGGMPVKGWPKAAPQSWEFRFGGMALAIAAAILTFSFAREPARLRLAVERATRNLRESEQRFRSLFEASFESVVVHQDGVILDVNPAFERMFGYSIEEAIGMPVLELVEPLSRPEVERRIRGRIEGAYEIVGVRKDGAPFDIEVAGKQHVYRGMNVRVAAIRDISPHKRAQEALQFRLEFERLIASISTQFINLGALNVETEVRQALEQLGRFVGADRCYVFLLSEDRSRMIRYADWTAPGATLTNPGLPARPLSDFPWFTGRLLRLETVHIPRVADLPPEAVMERRQMEGQGTRSSITVPLAYAGALVGFMGFSVMREERSWSDDAASLLRTVGEILVNTLERRRAEDDLRKSLARLDEANHQLQDYAANLESRVRDRTLELNQQKEMALEASRLKSEFLSVISHELRTPLNSILGLAQLVLMKTDESLPPRQRENLRAIVSSGKRLLDMINQLLDLSRIEAGMVEVSLSTFSTDLPLAEAAQAIIPLAEAKGLEFAAHNEAPGAYMHSDCQKIVQILLNLLGNAVKFTDQGRIELLVAEETGGFTFIVEDTGIGLTADETEIIFERFRQADSSSTRRYGGTGLGLTISRHLAQLLGGRLGVASRKGEGSAFTLWIPRVYHLGMGQSEEMKPVAAARTEAARPAEQGIEWDR